MRRTPAYPGLRIRALSDPTSKSAAAVLTATVAALGAGVGACASPGYPPGGPPRVVPPQLVGVAPETLAVNASPRSVVFTFDEVTNEAGRGGGAAGGIGGGATGLEAMVLVSPRNGSVSVDWGGDKIYVRQRRGFRPNVTYTVTILPGLADLRNNARDSAVVAVFTTGGAVARGELRGVVFDWVNGRTAPSAVVEAVAADSVPYVTLADSTGRFVIPNVPLGTYLVRAAVDVNGNRAIDPREPYDTLRAAAAERAGPPVFTRPITPEALEAELRVPVDTGANAGATPRPRPRRTARAGPVDTTTPALALYAFVHDTLGPRVGTVSVADSVTLRLAFDRSLRPDQPFAAAQVRVVAADSAVVPVREVLTAAAAAAADSAAQAQTRAAADSARRDSTPATPNGPGTPRPAAAPPTPPRATGPRLLRPVPPQELVVRLGAPLRSNAIYRITVRDLRSLSNVAGTTSRTFTTPRAQPPAQPARPTPAAPARPPAGAPPTRGP